MRRYKHARSEVAKANDRIEELKQAALDSVNLCDMHNLPKLGPVICPFDKDQTVLCKDCCDRCVAECAGEA